MTTDRAPAVPSRYRHIRPQSGPAWQAAWTMLADGKAYPRAEIIAVMRAANPISHRTARDVLTNATNDGLLTVVSRDRYTRPTLKRADK